ncbi:hypothetical protein J5X98_02105 [Leptothermofonsia sichuanensis E412]|uniref:hypothetical protein n=1 Tax=Leptothermofonsia sichuanensis TaxID=2917832 RepID=UPI001CA6A5DB|nr:hypothetical protein [Leptothermofonsia sichuanensis]QZZ21301.1 hypothetical protein J5X98_02105 [Leptothermofonsia sichuanensis E412]
MNEEQPIVHRSLTEIRAILMILAQEIQHSKREVRDAHNFKDVHSFSAAEVDLLENPASVPDAINQQEDHLLG